MVTKLYHYVQSTHTIAIIIIYVHVMGLDSVSYYSRISMIHIEVAGSPSAALHLGGSIGPKQLSAVHLVPKFFS